MRIQMLDYLKQLNFYESIKYNEDEEYRNKINSIYSKLSLIFNFSTISNVNNIDKIYELNLSGCLNLIDISQLNLVNTLDLSFCQNITNVNKLKYVEKLSLSNCSHIKQLNGLDCVHTLNLSNCKNMRDISRLTGVYLLELSACIKIKDIGNLRKLKKLMITTNIEGIHLLKELEELRINENYSKKISRRIKKLRKINPTVKIDII